MTVPSITRMVHFYPSDQDKMSLGSAKTVPVSAVITNVLDPEKGRVNLTLFPDGCNPLTRGNIFLKGNQTEGNSYWEWPPVVPPAPAVAAQAINNIP